MSGICPRCKRNVFSYEEKKALGKVWHTFCFSCRICRRLLDDDDVQIHGEEIFCNDCYERRDELLQTISEDQISVESENLTDAQHLRKVCPHLSIGLPPHGTPSPIGVTSYYARHSVKKKAFFAKGELSKPHTLFPEKRSSLIGDPHCFRCGNKVFHAETRQVEGSLYHDACFTCQCCRKPLNMTNVNVFQGEIYCKICFQRIVGPAGYGYGAGAGALQSF